MVEHLNSARPIQSALRVEDFSFAFICLVGSISLLRPVLVNYPTDGAYKNWPNQWSHSTCSNAYNCLRQQYYHTSFVWAASLSTLALPRSGSISTGFLSLPRIELGLMKPGFLGEVMNL